MTTIELDGSKISSAADFHREFAANPAVPSFYGRNLSALHDALTGLIELPITIVWQNAADARKSLGADFEKLADVLRRAENERLIFHLID